MQDLLNAAQIALCDCMNLQKQENLLILTDDETIEIGHALFEIGKKFAGETSLVVMPVRKVNGEEPPSTLAELMTRYDVVICPTQKSLTHTAARRHACKSGSRVATMPGISKEVMIRTLKADYHKIAERTYKLSAILNDAQEVRITTELGSDIKIPVKGIKAISSTGLVTKRGSFGNLPSGESYLMPQEGKSNGIFVVDGSFAGVGKIVENPVAVTVVDGFAVKIEGGIEAKKLESMLQPLGKQAYNIAELGIGTNDQAIITGQILEDEKVMGTVHIALGNNVSMGGSCDVGIHLDGVMLKPTVTVDGKSLMQKGNLMLID
jgi:leucyl aminopeptidase (aminopeptidase T)